MPVFETCHRIFSKIKDSIIEPVPPELRAFADQILQNEVPMIRGASAVELHTGYVEIQIPLPRKGMDPSQEEIIYAFLLHGNVIIIQRSGVREAHHLFS